MTQDKPGLFDLPEPVIAAPVITDTPISPVQIASIRDAFDIAGITDMSTRQEVIQSCVVRRITNIRELYSRDVRQILSRIDAWGRKTEPASGSAWDNREEDTWIDKL
ncbi:hypothetical protein [Arthrobacter sp. YN]|uniref:hypothetical protein n=1 Tax=Arthrobacter sp. YN TaxID=2020486 RepID=UPI000B5FD52F|nr:hypothetical protein [Arthrobacter sp. YN]ASN19314.1 hypothetical protein CGK93_06130 [Arthrobacter sp. YN]